MNVILPFGKCTAILVLFLVNTVACSSAAWGQHHKPAEPVSPAVSPAHQTPEDNKSANFWMEQKLRLSQEILTGLANGDFDQIGKSAEVMRGLNRVEAFVRREPQGYRDYLRQFKLANEELVRSAADENLAAATLAFNQLTISCVNCHRHLRESE